MVNIKSIVKFWKSKNGKEPIRVPKDPVCGMEPTKDIDLIYENIKYSFCSDHCKQQFEKDPEDYITK